MTSADDKWLGPGTAASGADGSRREKFRFELEADGTTLAVTILDRERPTEPYAVRLTTRTGGRSPVRRDYRVGAYATIDAAIERAEALLDLLDARIRDGAVSGKDPAPGEIRAVVTEFTGPRIGTRLRRLGSRLVGRLRAAVARRVRRR